MCLFPGIIDCGVFIIRCIRRRTTTATLRGDIGNIGFQFVCVVDAAAAAEQNNLRLTDLDLVLENGDNANTMVSLVPPNVRVTTNAPISTNAPVTSTMVAIDVVAATNAPFIVTTNALISTTNAPSATTTTTKQ